MNERLKFSGEKLRNANRIVGLAVDKRKWLYVLAAVLLVFCVFSAGWTGVGNSLVSYLPDSANARQGVDLMEVEFADLADAHVLLENVSKVQAENIAAELEQIHGVYSVQLDGFNDRGLAELVVAFDQSDNCRDALDAVKDAVSLYDGGVYSSLDAGWDSSVDWSMVILMVSAGVLLALAALLVSRSYADILVMFISIGAAVLINYGTNFVFGDISSITNLSTGVLLSAMTMYYAALICRRYSREHKHTENVREAVMAAVDGCALKILTSALIALVVLGALMTAKLGVALEFGLVLLKGVVITLICMFVLLPCLIVSFSKLMDKSKHKNLLPKVKNFGNYISKTKYALPIIFIVLALGALIFNIVYNIDPYAYSGDRLAPVVKNSGQSVENTINSVIKNGECTVYLLVPAGDYETEKTVSDNLESISAVQSVRSLTNSEAAGYIVTDKLSVWQFKDITGLDTSAAWSIYSGYAALAGVDTTVNLAEYEVPFIDIINYTYNLMQDGSFTLDDELTDTIIGIHHEMSAAESELKGESCDRIIINVRLSSNYSNAASLLNQLKTTAEDSYDGGVYLTGDNGGIIELADTYSFDSTVVMILTTVLSLAVLLIILKKVVPAILLTLVLQGGAWLTMDVPYIFPGRIMFIGVMFAYAIQILAGTNYAAVIAHSYQNHKKDKSLQGAINLAMKENFTLILITGVVFILSGLILALLSFNATVMTLGFSLMISGAISLILALCVIPQLLVMLDSLVDRKNNNKKKAKAAKSSKEPPAQPVEQVDQANLMDMFEQIKATAQDLKAQNIPTDQDIQNEGKED